MNILTLRNIALTVILSAVVALAIPVKESRAICETTIQVTGSQAASETAQSSAVTSVIESIKGFITPILSALQLDMLNQIQAMSDFFRGQMGDTWGEWQDLYKGMTAQLHTAEIDQSRVKGSINDAGNYLEHKLENEQNEVEARKRYEVSEESCVYDSTLPAYNKVATIALSAESKVASKFSTGYVNTSAPVINITANQFNENRALFCNPAENGGNNNCPGTSPRMDEDVEISVLDSDTIEITNPVEDALVMETTVDNLLGRPKSHKIPPSALQGSAGREAALKKRASAAQLDLAAGLISTPMTERLPQGINVGGWRPLLESIGIPPNLISDTPSKHEMLQGYIEYMQNPEFYQRLGGGEATLAQKDLHVKAIKLMLMDSDLAYTEKLMSMFSVQLANYLDQYSGTGAD